MPFQSADYLAWAHPLVREWFIAKFGSPTEPQIQGWPSILAGKTTLISAPTGSGKTLSAFLVCIDQLVRKALAHELIDQTDVVYVSPLKALGNDIQKNLLAPLQEIAELAQQRGWAMAEIRVAVRTGDTEMRERQRMLRHPPHILVTTPESLYILLTAEKSRQFLMNVKTVIVDEIHAMANDKRGAHLTLSLERLEALTQKSLLRIGLSATQKPMEIVAAFLNGNQRPSPSIINIGYARQLDIAVMVPPSELGAVASNEMWDEIYDQIAELSKQHRSTLVFVNTRRLAERVAHHVAERIGEKLVASHHGSLSRKLRLDAETKLKNGELPVLVATASLELGIDIGSIDLVCQIGSPRAIAVALQRIGRAGHWHGAISRGRIFATTRDELIECAALVYAIRCGDLDQLIIPVEPLDILAQQIVAICATGDWQEDDLYALVTRAYHYKDLSRENFDAIMAMLGDGMASTRGRYGAYLFRDRVNGVVKARRNARLTAITSGGAIPENGLFTVIAEPNGVMVGTLDEDFAVESSRGDIILLGTTSWQIRRIEANSGKVYVADAHGAPPSVPFWRGEAPARTIELSAQVSALRKKVSAMLPNPCPPITEAQSHPDIAQALQWLKEQAGLDQSGAEQLLEYLRQGKCVLGAVPTQETIIAERFFDESGGMQLIIHAPFGARINKAWGLALRKRFCRSFNFELQAAATDDGLNIALAEQHSFPLADVFSFLHPNSIKEVLVQAVLQSPLFPTRWRWDAGRALAIVRFRGGKKVPPNILRMLSDDLLAAVFPDAAACQDNLAGKDIELPDHPLINEALKDALNEALDLEGLTNLLRKIVNGEVECLAVDTPLPSPFAHEILNANPYAFLDDAPLEERRARAVSMRRVLPEALLQEVGRLDPAAIQEVQQQAWPDVRDEDELHDLLQTLGAYPRDSQTLLARSNDNWEPLFATLLANGRVGMANHQGREFYFATESAQAFYITYPEAVILHAVPPLPMPAVTVEQATETILRGWMLHLGPTDHDELSKLLGWEPSLVEQVLVKLEMTGLILRGSFFETNNATKSLQWCERRLLARIHRLTLGRLRKEIAPVTSGQFVHWLMSWQHVAPGTQLQGERGLLEVLRQLQGFEMPANAWERQVLAKRVKDYDADMLDQLCLTGQVGWGRLSLPVSMTANRRVMPTSVAPITFFLRDEADWLSGHQRFTDNDDLPGLTPIAKNIAIFLRQRGASFFTDIVRGVGSLKSEVETGLWELVAAGVITADGFDNLRALIDPRRRLDKRGRRNRPRHSAGRWSLLHTDEVTDQRKQMEATCWMLLRRYGVVFRDLLAREKLLPRWRELLIAFRRLEDRGEIRGGRFVSGFLGEQFALPYAVESLRAMKKASHAGTGTIKPVNVAAVDPLNLVGIILPGVRAAAISGRVVAVGEEEQ